ncbi:unnamed protein product [Allacma fusca]|uniref:Arginase n=1 Tax=Allacma fusca TaxID=39272 RepID=A0A8J2PMU8_9HEXA|nr:unnamed protein product [Allacma fusca]
MLSTKSILKFRSELKVICLSGNIERAYTSLYAGGRPSPTVKVGVQSVPFAKGQPKPGVDHGPELIKNTGFITQLQEIGADVKDYGAVDFSRLPSHVEDNGSSILKHTGLVASANKLISDATSKILRDGRICLNLGGDHSIGIGTIHGASEVYEDLAVLWVDAHADINTPYSSWSGNYHGMAASFNIEEMQPYLGKLDGFSWMKPKIKAKNLAFIGLRDVDDLERRAIEMTGIHAFSTKEVSNLGIEKVLEIALELICPGGKRPLHLSFDIDALDDLEVKSTGTPVPGGLTLREGLTVVEKVRQMGNLVSMDLVEVNPWIGTQEDVKRTANVSKQLLLNTFGPYPTATMAYRRSSCSQLKKLTQEEQGCSIPLIPIWPEYFSKWKPQRSVYDCSYVENLKELKGNKTYFYWKILKLIGVHPPPAVASFTLYCLKIASKGRSNPVRAVGEPRRALKVGVQSIPFGKGQPIPGVEHGPELIKNTGFITILQEIGTDVKDYGAINFSQLPRHKDCFSSGYCNGSSRAKNTGAVGSANKLISAATSKILRDGRISLNLGGDHSISIGTIHGASEVYEDLAVLWVDAHSDINTPCSTKSGNYHGMPVGFNLVEMQPYIGKIDAFAWMKPKYVQ